MPNNTYTEKQNLCKLNPDDTHMCKLYSNLLFSSDKEHEGANRISNQFRESNDYNNGSKNEKRNIEKETIADVR